MDINMKLMFTCWIFFCLFGHVCMCVHFHYSRPATEKWKSAFHNQVKMKNRVVMEEILVKTMLTVMLAPPSLQNSLFNLTRQLITPTLFTERGSLCGRGQPSQILTVILLRMCLFLCKTVWFQATGPMIWLWQGTADGSNKICGHYGAQF